MNSWHQVRVEGGDDNQKAVVVTETSHIAEELEHAPGADGDAAQTSGPNPTDQAKEAVVEPEPIVGRRVLPRPEPTVCSTCLGVGTLRVAVAGGQVWHTSTSAAANGPGAYAQSVSTTQFRQVTCATCSGLGWVLVAPSGPVRPVTVPMPAPDPWTQWWHQIGDLGPLRNPLPSPALGLPQVTC